MGSVHVSDESVRHLSELGHSSDRRASAEDDPEITHLLRPSTSWHPVGLARPAGAVWCMSPRPACSPRRCSPQHAPPLGRSTALPGQAPPSPDPGSDGRCRTLPVGEVEQRVGRPLRQELLLERRAQVGPTSPEHGLQLTPVDVEGRRPCCCAASLISMRLPEASYQ